MHVKARALLYKTLLYFLWSPEIHCTLSLDSLAVLLSESYYLHIDVIPFHYTAQVFISGKDSMEAVVVDICDNHLKINSKTNKLTAVMIP